MGGVLWSSIAVGSPRWTAKDTSTNEHTVSPNSNSQVSVLESFRLGLLIGVAVYVWTCRNYWISPMYYTYRFALGAPSYHSLPVVEVTMSESGECHGVLMWWTADMSGIELSMSPWQYTQVYYHHTLIVTLFHCTLCMYYGYIPNVLFISGGTIGFRLSSSFPTPSMWRKVNLMYVHSISFSRWL